MSEAGALWTRAGLGAGTPMGTHWLRVEVRPRSESQRVMVMLS